MYYQYCQLRLPLLETRNKTFEALSDIGSRYDCVGLTVGLNCRWSQWWSYRFSSEKSWNLIISPILTHFYCIKLHRALININFYTGKYLQSKKQISYKRNHYWLKKIECQVIMVTMDSIFNNNEVSNCSRWNETEVTSIITQAACFCKKNAMGYLLLLCSISLKDTK